MFQNLRVNSQVYILHKDNNPYIECGSVMSVSAPKPKYPSNMPIGSFPQVETVVDLVVNINGQNTNFNGLPAGLDVADFGQNGNIVITCSRDAMNNEVTMMKQKSMDIVNSIDYHRGVIANCDKMLNLLNPEYAEKQRQEREMSDMREQMAQMSKTLNALMNRLAERPNDTEAQATSSQKQPRNK